MVKVFQIDVESPVKQAQLLELIRNTTIPGAVTYHYERPTRYEVFAKIQGTHFQLWAASENNSLLGFTQITFDQVTWNDLPVTVSYSGDTRVSTSARGRKISDSLIQASCNQHLPVFGAVLDSNKLVLNKKLKDWDLHGIHFKEYTKLKALLYTPAPIKTPSSKLLCRFANESDLPAMHHLWKTYSQTRNLPRYYENQESFSNSYFQTTGVSLEHTFLIFDGISLIAMLSIWNQSKARCMVVDHKNIWMKIASPFIVLPKAGEELKVLHSFQHAFIEKHPLIADAIRMLIIKARTYTHYSKSNFFSFGLDEKDPIYLVAKKSAIITNTVNIILDSRGNNEFITQNKPLHLEVGMG